MFKYPLQILSVSLLFILWQGCAQMTPLTGGTRDKTPPKLVSAVPETLTCNFKQHIVVLKFDEYIQLKDLNTQLVISPKLKQNPEIVSDGKKVIIRIDTNDLQPKTTYRFFFGEAIVDMNESNPLKNFEYIFSTGKHIDSLKISGTVKDAFNNAPIDNTLISLYTNSLQNDSLPYIEVPNYITKTNAQGEFKFDHLPVHTYKAYAITDANKNFMYDRGIEKIGFLDQVLVLEHDSSIAFRLFQEEAAKLYIKKTISPYYGLSKIILNKKSAIQISPLDPLQAKDIYIAQTGTISDSINVYYKNQEDSLKLLVKYPDDKRIDTVQLSLAKKSSKKKKFAFIRLNTSGNSLPLGKPIIISFITWMDTNKTNWQKLKLISNKDSIIDTMNVNGRWLNIHQLELSNKLNEGSNYTLLIDTSAFSDIYTQWNDSVRFRFTAQSKTEFGKVSLKMVLNKKQQYLIQLINEKEVVIKEQMISFSLSSSNAKTVEFTSVLPGKYLTRIVFDDNKNNKWDSGNLFLKQQAETVIINSKELKVVSDWEIEEEIVLKE